jgi:uncharacterized protein (DUF779 family)
MQRVDVTEAAADMLRWLTEAHGPLMFHQSGGCCDGLDEPVEVWMSGSQFEYWKHTHLTIDIVEGRGGGFSVEAPEGVRFLIRSRLLTDQEYAALVGAE